MKDFLFGIMSEEGNPSSKRVTMFALLFIFLFVYMVNLFTGKIPSQVLVDQNFYLLTTAMGLVFGSNIINKIADVKKTQSENNKQVGEPSPTPPTVIATDKPVEKVG